MFGMTNPLNISEYSHVTMIFKKGNYTENSIYINGVKQNLEQSFGGINSSRAVFGTYFNISGWSYGSRHRLNGSIMDEVYIWNRPLSDTEVTSLYNSLNN